ncbi:glycosyltransferase family 2 protein [Lacrimispora algidixylanolytica]|uniref:Glycosyltransferase 2-like domain-containing protein n=1 Tax=Lacrimispora algidixylanolytica TaxID=94868 RepID=A0A419TBH8_9FIRM|nr:glycosyltransferase family 2 protein [Lacrimispora algidixylanolytica]RKD34836.1 hypothetical protein BET01_00270 [Lacrimispora algidixylanolytica]
MLFSIIVPCYNEEKNLERLAEAFDEITAPKYPIELILVDNGSTDNSAQVLKNISNTYSFVKVVTVEVNQGYGFGILSGLEQARGDYLGWLHADMQFYPREICKAIQYLKKHQYPDDVFLRGFRKKRPVIDTVFTLGMSLFESLYLGQFMWDINAQPTLISRKFYDKWKCPPKDFSLDLYVYYLACREGLEIYRFGVIQHERNAGTSTWNTGMRSRIGLVRRVFSYSRSLKNELGVAANRTGRNYEKDH